MRDFKSEKRGLLLVARAGQSTVVGKDEHTRCRLNSPRLPLIDTIELNVEVGHGNNSDV